MARQRDTRPKPRKRPSADRAPAPDGYFYHSTRPLHMLAFLLPLVIAYEAGSVFYLYGEQAATTIKAWRILGSFFEVFDVVGLHLPAIALVVVLLAWHQLVRDPWKIRPAALAGMAGESVAWTLPLLVMAGLLAASRAPEAAPLAHAAMTIQTLLDLPWQARLTISLGAGLYEELLFRMILIAAVHFVAVDLLRLKDHLGRAVAVVVSAAAFTFYHDLTSPVGGLDMLRMVYYALAGLFFGVLYLWRGFGIVVGTHALYDIVVLVLLPAAVEAG